MLRSDPNPATANNPLVYSVPDSLTFFGQYTFARGPLDKLAIGGGFVQNWGPIYVDSPATSGLANQHGYFTANAFVRYPVRIYRHHFGLQAAVNNLTDDRYMMNGGFSSPRERLLSVEGKLSSTARTSVRTEGRYVSPIVVIVMVWLCSWHPVAISTGASSP